MSEPSTSIEILDSHDSDAKVQETTDTEQLLPTIQSERS